MECANKAASRFKALETRINEKQRQKAVPLMSDAHT